MCKIRAFTIIILVLITPIWVYFHCEPKMLLTDWDYYLKNGFSLLLIVRTCMSFPSTSASWWTSSNTFSIVEVEFNAFHVQCSLIEHLRSVAQLRKSSAVMLDCYFHYVVGTVCFREHLRLVRSFVARYPFILKHHNIKNKMPFKHVTHAFCGYNDSSLCSSCYFITMGPRL